jgi:hypothetical protein
MSLTTLFKDVAWNLDTVASIDNHQTLLVFGDRLDFDTRVLQSIRRALTDDGRDQILRVIDKSLTLAKEMLVSYQHSVYLQRPIQFHTLLHQEHLDIAETINNQVGELNDKKEKIIQGLTILSTFERYKQDSAFQIKIANFISVVERLCTKCVELQTKYKMLKRHDRGVFEHRDKIASVMFKTSFETKKNTDSTIK